MAVHRASAFAGSFPSSGSGSSLELGSSWGCLELVSAEWSAAVVVGPEVGDHSVDCQPLAGRPSLEAPTGKTQMDEVSGAFAEFSVSPNKQRVSSTGRAGPLASWKKERAPSLSCSWPLPRKASSQNSFKLLPIG